MGPSSRCPRLDVPLARFSALIWGGSLVWGSSPGMPSQGRPAGAQSALLNAKYHPSPAHGVKLAFGLICMLLKIVGNLIKIYTKLVEKVSLEKKLFLFHNM